MKGPIDSPLDQRIIHLDSMSPSYRSAVADTLDLLEEAAAHHCLGWLDCLLLHQLGDVSCYHLDSWPAPP